MAFPIRDAVHKFVVSIKHKRKWLQNLKKTSCNYGPNDRVISDLSKKTWKPKNKVNNAFDSIAFKDFLNKASVDFRKSNTQKDSCKTYFINGYWDEKPISIRVENCEKSVELLQLSSRSE